MDAVLKIPVMIEAYYSVSGAINGHNNQCQYDLKI